jgi:ribosomal protein S12 methylthiotransferase
MSLFSLNRISYAQGIKRWNSTSSTLRWKRSKKLRKEDVHSPEFILFRSLGCPRNFVDTEVMMGLVLQKGYEVTSDLGNADYIVLNTCGFLESAREESKAEIRELIQKRKDGSKLIVTGCMVNLHRDQILNDFPEVHRVLSAGSVDKILDALTTTRDLDNDQKEIVDVGVQRRSYLESGEVPRSLGTPPHYAYLKIAEGCRKRCSFCIIPKIKGKLQSKPVHQIVQEFRALLECGVKEVILIAQDLGDYGKDRFEKDGLTGLLQEILKHVNEKDIWIRLLYLYPDEITDDLISLMEAEPRICRYLDMPIQHISDPILKRMKRKTTSEQIRETISKLRLRLPGIHIRTSLMVGFPGETEEDFELLLDFVREVKLDNVGVFSYSNEELASSFQLDQQVSESIKQDRWDRLMQAQLEVVTEKNREKIGTEMDVVIEGLHPDDHDIVVGRYYGQCPDIDGQVIILADSHPEPGKRYPARVIDFENYDLVVELIER